MRRRFQLALPLIGVSSHALWTLLSPEPHWIKDHLLYNGIWILILFLAIQAPIQIDRVGVAALSIALFLWGSGSLLASLAEFESQSLSLAAQLSYSLFYPFLLIAIPRLVGTKRKLTPVEVLDAMIFGLGLTSIIAALLLTFIFSDTNIEGSELFFLIFNPVGDIALLLVSILLIIYSQLNRQSLLILCGITIFALTDIQFFNLSTHNRYSFGSVIDDGWLLGIYLVVTSLYQERPATEIVRKIHPIFISLSIFASPILLAISALNPGAFPLYLVLLCLATLLLAFIRMSGAIREARALSDERVLSRTDELTGLPNRRRMISEIDSFSAIEGALLLLDLDGFKPVNDRFGHDTGDALLREVARRFNRVLPDGDLLARLGGDEFGALIKGDSESTLEVAHALAASLSYPFRIKGHEISIGVSIGHVFNDGAGKLLERADSAMYEAKRNRKPVVTSQKS